MDIDIDRYSTCCISDTVLDPERQNEMRKIIPISRLTGKAS